MCYYAKRGTLLIADRKVAVMRNSERPHTDFREFDRKSHGLIGYTDFNLFNLTMPDPNAILDNRKKIECNLQQYEKFYEVAPGICTYESKCFEWGATFNAVSWKSEALPRSILSWFESIQHHGGPLEKL